MSITLAILIFLLAVVIGAIVETIVNRPTDRDLAYLKEIQELKIAVAIAETRYYEQLKQNKE
jgi:hypothetical protein